MKSVKSKVINIKSEILYRSAEDDFFYFYKINSAYKKLKEALILTPNHLKSLVLLADVYCIKGYTKKALELYLKASKINSSNTKVLASAANCFYILKDYNKALNYCNLAVSKTKIHNYALLSQVFEMKINILINQKRYLKAYETCKIAKKIFNNPFWEAIYSAGNKILNKKINLQKKLLKSDLKIV